MNEWSFRDEIQLSPLDPARAALYFAQGIAYPGLAVAEYVARLDELATAVRQITSVAAPIQEQTTTLAHYLFQELGFQGNTGDYFNPDNSYLNQVLDRRLGIPITLSVLYLGVAHRLELPVFGVNLPGHFIVGARAQGDILLLDPFHGGAPLTRTECRELVARTSGYHGPFQSHWLLPAAPRNILARMLNNLRLIYIQQQMWTEAQAVLDHLHWLQPAMPQHLRDLGLLSFQQGEMYRAADYLEKYVQLNPDGEDVPLIRRNLQAAFDKWVQLN